MIPPLPDGRPCWTDVALNPLVEGQTVTFILYAQKQEGWWRAVSLIRRYNLNSHTWGDPIFFPETWNTSEGSLTRAKNGDIVAAFRTGRPGIAAPSDHWRGISTSRSTDNGETWSEPTIQLLYGHGHAHQSLLNLPAGQILMTCAARISELEGRTYHGIEAALSHDHGQIWDWEHRYILFRWPNQHMHSPQSVALPNGRILSVFMHSTAFSWTGGDRDSDANLTPISNISVVIWHI